jgi:L-ribulose-5-phosphate 3-epimerase
MQSEKNKKSTNKERGFTMKNIFAVSTNSYHGFTLDQALEGIAAAGFKYVELVAVKNWTEHVMADMSEEELNRVKQKMSDLGLKAVALSGHCNIMDDQRLKDFEDNIDLAKKFDCEFIVTSSGEAHFGKDERVADDVLVKNIKKLLPKLEQNQIKLVLEIHGEYGTGEALYRVTQEVNSPWVGINYDTANVVLYGGKLPNDDVKVCVDDVKYVHLKDKVGINAVWNFPAIGTGDLDLAGFMDYLDEHGYTGPYSIELEYTEEFCMRDKDQPGDLDFANKALKDSYDYLKSIGRV